MANFGTPFVIGTLTSTTNTASYTVPITTTNGTPVTGDGFAVYVASSSISSGGPPVTQITDTKSNQYFEVNSSSVTQQISEWRSATGIALTSSDTLTVTFASSTNSLKDICVVDLPGVASGGIDQVVSNSGSGNPGIITASATPVYSSELCMFASANGGGGGSPTNLATSGFTVLTTLHSGSSEWLQVGYQIISTSATVTPTSNITGTTNNWAALLTTSTAGTIPQFVQQPFPLGQLNPAIAFNPAYSNQLRVLSSQVVPATTQNVNILGSQSGNYNVGLTNFLTTVNTSSSTFESSVGSWSNGTGTTVARSTLQAHTGSACLAVTSTSGGSSNAFSTSQGKGINTLPVTVGDTLYGGMWVQAASFPRSANAQIDYFDINGTNLGSVTGTVITDAVLSWQFIYIENVASIAGTVGARLHVTFAGNNVGEVHYIDDAVFYNLSTNNSPNQVTIYQQFWQQYPYPVNGVPFPLSLNPTLQYQVRQIPTANAFGSLAGTTAASTVVANPGAISVTQNYQMQFPFANILPVFMEFSPAYMGLRQQYNTGNTPTYIDGGTPSSVVTFNNFPDNAVTISVSATSNIAVAAPVPQTIINGVTANVNVATSGQEVVIVVDITPPNISVTANSGSVNIIRSGIVSNVSAASTGIVSLGPANLTSNVTVQAVPGSLLIKLSGTVANTGVASTGIAVVSPQGQAANVNASARAGILSEALQGTIAQVSIASSGKATDSVAGANSSVSVSAISGGIQISQVIAGIAAHVNVASSGIPSVSVLGIAANITSAAVAGTITISAKGIIANINTFAPIGEAGQIALLADLIDSDLHMDMLLSEEGRLMTIPVENILVSATKTEPSQSQGI
jgi:hypothetical protein